MYDVGKIARDIQDQFGLFARVGVPPTPNKATPENLAVLLDALDTLTDEIYVQREASNFAWSEVGEWDGTFSRWSDRLRDYKRDVSDAPAGDRQVVLWKVTAPLLLGFFGGADAHTAPRQPIDAITPFTLANQLQVSEEWREERWQLFLEDLKTNADELVPDSSTIKLVGTLAAIGFGGWLAAKVFRR